MYLVIIYTGRERVCALNFLAVLLVFFFTVLNLNGFILFEEFSGWFIYFSRSFLMDLFLEEFFFTIFYFFSGVF